MGIMIGAASACAVLKVTCCCLWRYNLYCLSPSAFHLVGKVGSFRIASCMNSIVMQRGGFALPFGRGTTRLFSGTSWALMVEVKRQNSKKSIEGTVKRFSKGTFF